MAEQHYWTYAEKFELEKGGHLPEFTMSYSTLGSLNEAGDNVVWVCHALTGNSNVLDWWPGLFEKNSVLSPEKYFIICANMLGGCYGSTGSLSINPKTNQKYYHSFPFLTNFDMVKAFDLLREGLGISRINTVIGGSMGGQQALEWCIYRPEIFNNLIGLATNAAHSPWAIAFNESQRMAIQTDPSWKESNDTAGIVGMKTARAIALHSYRSYDIYKKNQAEDGHTTDDFRASSYQRYQGDKLANRFNAFTYWTLSKAMDSHNVGRGRKTVENALSLIKADCHFIGINSDILFPLAEQEFLARCTRHSDFDVIDSGYGHDGFLVETDKINNVLRKSR
ncbi:MAG: homoserine O-acetyltransferase [Bacteroidetes bacterium]|nr:homoserine O-acetyltransferase [Bacteroidota bacterium]MDA1119686.1 homoserine O-acetyltransferase [Bacteroidota bacterium]